MNVQEFISYIEKFERVALCVDQYVMETTERRARLEQMLPAGDASQEMRCNLAAIMKQVEKVEQHLSAARLVLGEPPQGELKRRR